MFCRWSRTSRWIGVINKNTEAKSWIGEYWKHKRIIILTGVRVENKVILISLSAIVLCIGKCACPGKFSIFELWHFYIMLPKIGKVSIVCLILSTIITAYRIIKLTGMSYTLIFFKLWWFEYVNDKVIADSSFVYCNHLIFLR